MSSVSIEVPLFRIYWDDEDLQEVEDSIKRGSYWANGPKIDKFQNILSDYVGREYTIAFNSGTSALHACMLGYEIGKGDEVIVPSFTFIATCNAPLFVGAKPVFAEVEDRTYGLNPEHVKEKITDNTAAIMPIHYGGRPCQIKALKEIAEDHDLLLIEDAAESLGSELDDQKVGTFGDSVMFSFCQNKVVTTGEGGAILTDDKSVYEKLKLVRSQGRAETEDYFATSEYMDYVDLGYNFRMSDLTAALGVSQLRKIEEVTSMRRKNAEYITERLTELDEIKTPQPSDSEFHVYQMYTVEVEGGKEKRDKLRTWLTHKNIGCKVYFDPVHHTTFYQDKFGYAKGYLPDTEELSERVLTIPMCPDLTEKEMNYVVKEIEEFVEENY